MYYLVAVHTQRPPTSQIAIYAVGQLGWSLASFGAINLLLYFYMPPETGEEPLFPVVIYQGAILGIATVIGLLNAGSRLFDAITDPWIAGLSDRLKGERGKRKRLMGWAAVPFALFSVAVFLPLPGVGETLNTLWLAVGILLFYFFLTLYVIPYTALIGELGHHPDDRMKISTWISLAWAVGFLIGSTVYAVQGAFAPAMGALAAFQTTVAVYAGIALVAMLVPVIWLNERRYAEQQATDTDAWTALRKVWANRDFRYFGASDMLYWLSLTFIQLGVSYYATALLGLDIGFASVFLAVGFFCSFLLYWPVNLAVRRFGKKAVLSSAFLVFGGLFLTTFMLPQIPLSGEVLIYILAVWSAYPIAVFSIVPNAVLADLVHVESARSGTYQPGMFYAARNFLMKVGITLANLIFPSLLLLGKSTENPFGVRLSALLAFGFLLVGAWLFSRYTERVLQPVTGTSAEGKFRRSR